MVYIRQSALPGLKQYRYAGVDHSLLSRYVLKPFYTHIALPCFPLWMAPNLITLIGFSFVIANFVTLLWYAPGLDADCPRWVYVSWAVGLFLYQTFDAVDGGQARRTHQSGPLGELFDHGVDAVNTTLEVLLFAATMKFGQSWNTVLVLFASLFTFYVQTWDEYHTHILTLGLVSGPVEGITTLYIVYALTAMLGGGSFWQQSVLRSLGVEKPGFMPDAIYEIAYNESFIVYGALVLIFNTIQSSISVIEARRQRGQRARHGLKGLIPPLIIWILVATYLHLHPLILRHHLVPFALFVGLMSAYSVGQIIVRHLTKDRFPYGNVIVIPLAYGVIDSLGPVLQRTLGFGWPSALGDDVYQVALVFLCLGLAAGVYGTWVVDVIFTICDYLDIWCLTIKHPYREGEGEGGKKVL